ncbi:MAG: NADH-ubiquinone oxidoreductase-F iron-sulfur binding region domain-containing protein [Parcubacteria group bacterium]|jgi:NADH:ubiquinone oxidoreductase subunit F (NADH-binding)
MNNTKIITKHWGRINPLKIEDYVAIGGYKALKKYIRDMDAERAIGEIKKSGLCGRGGAGFPTGNKLEIVAEKNGTKYFICNLDESEPGTYKDRAIVDNNPHSLIEGIIISALIIGAKRAIIYINGRYIKQKEILEIAVEQAGKYNFLGKGIIGSCYDLGIEIFSGAGAYICGEETALINSIEGNRGEPKSRPPYPTDAGLFGKPTVINNAETIVNIPWIITNGGEKYADSGGEKLYILGGSVKKPGVYEGSVGITIRQAIEKMGGGLKKGKEFWFAQIGGASGRLILGNELDCVLDYDRVSAETPRRGVSIMPIGSGSILVIDKTVDIKDLLLSWTTFFRYESCGKCVPCREGTFRLWEIAKRMQDGEITERDQKAIPEIIWTLQNTTFCPLGKFAATAFSDVMEKKLI